MNFEKMHTDVCHGESEASNDIIGQPDLQSGSPSLHTQVKSPPAGVTDKSW